MWGNNTGVSVGMIPGRKFFGPLFLVMVPPVFVHMVWYTNYHLDGSFLALANSFASDGFVATMSKAVPSPFTWQAWKIILTYMAVQATLMRVVPGKEFIGPTSNQGNVPIYKDNGVLAFFLSVLLFITGATVGLFEGGVIYNNSGNLLSSMNLFALLFCGFLYPKGIYFPSSTDCGTTGNILFDYYWGTELYPRIFGWDVKQFTNCRFGMVFWPISTISYAYAQYERFGYVSDSMIVNMSLQLCYCFKFFLWETGYLASMDI